MGTPVNNIRTCQSTWGRIIVSSTIGLYGFQSLQGSIRGPTYVVAYLQPITLVVLIGYPDNNIQTHQSKWGRIYVSASSKIGLRGRQSLQAIIRGGEWLILTGSLLIGFGPQSVTGIQHLSELARRAVSIGDMLGGMAYPLTGEKTKSSDVGKTPNAYALRPFAFPFYYGRKSEML